MKAHKYWSVGALITMIGTFYTGYKGLKAAHKYFAFGSAFCRVQRTPMRFRADAVQSTTDALKQCIFSYSRGFITTV